MNVVIRADGGGSVGWGHLSRCAALAEVPLEAGGMGGGMPMGEAFRNNPNMAAQNLGKGLPQIQDGEAGMEEDG